jgi:hypothetical protein
MVSSVAENAITVAVENAVTDFNADVAKFDISDSTGNAVAGMTLRSVGSASLPV